MQTALTSAAKHETVLVGDDADLLVLLIYHAKNVKHNVFFRPETRRASQKGNRCWNITAMRALLGSVVTNNIMFMHAILGCGTTSGVYSLGKKLSISKFNSDSQFQDQAKVFMSQGASKDNIISAAGETALVCLYNGNPHHGINVLRYEKFCVKAATVPVQPGALPSTSGSVKYQSLRVYHQIQEWLCVDMSSVLESQCRELNANQDRSATCPSEIPGSRSLRLQVCLRYHALLLQEAWDDLLYCLLRVQWCIC